MGYDCSGYASKYNLKCTDGVTILPGAFADLDGARVPCVWHHMHDAPQNVLGYADLEHREDGIYSRISFNDTPSGANAKTLVKHGDITGFSIYANNLRKKGSFIEHGVIKEVSLVLSGANPGALIDTVAIAHSDGSYTQADDEMILGFVEDEAILHEDAADKTVQEVFNSMSEEQKLVVYALVAEAAGYSDDQVEHSEMGGDEIMKRNVFEGIEHDSTKGVLSHADVEAIFNDAKKCGSLKEAYIAHASSKYGDFEGPNGIPGIDYGVGGIELLFPDYRNVRDTPDVVRRDDAWVQEVIGGANKTPFSKIRTMYFDITADVARARGYRKGYLKKDEVVKLAKRETGPTTIYKRQKLDRDDLIDITNFDIVSWLKREMQAMLREEIARAILISDGRAEDHPDKIREENIRPILKEDGLYAYDIEVDMSSTIENDRYRNLIREVRLGMDDYKGSGNTRFFTTKHHHTRMALIEDAIDHLMYSSERALLDALSVNKIVEVPVMTGIVDEEGRELIGIIVDMADYTIGTNAGGQMAFFDDFDIDFNQYTYLYETRLSGAMNRMDAAIRVWASKKAPVRISVTPLTGSTELGEVEASDLQEDVKISDTDNISGTLLYKDDFNEFAPGDEKLQHGNYLALKIENRGSSTKTVTITAQVLGMNGGAAKTLDSNGICVVRISDEMKQRLKITMRDTDGNRASKIFGLSGLNRNTEE